MRNIEIQICKINSQKLFQYRYLVPPVQKQIRNRRIPFKNKNLFSTTCTVHLYIIYFIGIVKYVQTWVGIHVYRQKRRLVSERKDTSHPSVRKYKHQPKNSNNVNTYNCSIYEQCCWKISLEPMKCRREIPYKCWQLTKVAQLLFGIHKTLKYGHGFQRISWCNHKTSGFTNKKFPVIYSSNIKHC
jgi:hypothetical protein